MFNKNQPAYESLRNIVAERTNGVVFWIGSGLSRPAGLPTWPELKTALCDALQSKIPTLDPREQADKAKQLATIRSEANPWVAFKMLRKALGDATYTATIRSQLSVADKARIPPTYDKLWKLQPAGVISLNLDRLVARSHATAVRDAILNETVGTRINTSLHFLKSPKPFIAYLHGLLDEKDTWVFTHDDLSKLMRVAGYKDFLVTCFASRTVVFVGVSADDFASGGHLARLSERKIDTGSHFWITDRRDTATDNWAEAAGIQTIRYATPSGSHAELGELLDDLASYMPKENEVDPVFASATVADKARRPPADLLAMSHESARKYLNTYARAIFEHSPTDSVYAEYDRFCKEYEAAIHHAWFVTAAEPNNVLCGYILIEEIAEGAFGLVYRASKPDGSQVAIKVLHERVRKQPEMLQSFRRGVNSMRILSRHNCQGMVPYLDASEIPAFVVMEFIEGPNLAEAVKHHKADDWGTILWIATEFVGIIRRSHMLRERVLHRDIKPSNIMIRNGWEDKDDWKIVVLDFDLSWHKDATEASVLHFSSASGFLAPEQVRRTPTASTRSAAVDSFGIGMTLYFLRTGDEPFPSQHQHRTWASDLDAYAKKFVHSKWKSLAARFFRLIKEATHHKQSKRWDVSQIESELLRLREAFTKPKVVRSAELWAEELAARANDLDYEWNNDRNCATIQAPSTKRFFAPKRLTMARYGPERA
jgi:eukaryotic-like serine/threonine-protein kinase